MLSVGESISLCFCYIQPTSVSSSFTTFLSYITLTPLYVTLICYGIAFYGNSIRLAVLNIGIFWLAFFILYGLSVAIQSPRPSSDVCAGLGLNNFLLNNPNNPTPVCSSILEIVVNNYAIPDPFMVTSIGFILSFLIVEVNYFGKKIPFLHYAIVGFIVIFYTTSEVVLSRMYIWQALLNLVFSFLLTMAMLYIIELLEFFPSFREAYFWRADLLSKKIHFLILQQTGYKLDTKKIYDVINKVKKNQ